MTRLVLHSVEEGEEVREVSLALPVRQLPPDDWPVCGVCGDYFGFGVSDNIQALPVYGQVPDDVGDRLLVEAGFPRPLLLLRGDALTGPQVEHGVFVEYDHPPLISDFRGRPDALVVTCSRACRCAVLTRFDDLAIGDWDYPPRGG